jgi:dTDP-4-dehydrorhamnose 3,5-epimerase
MMNITQNLDYNEKVSVEHLEIKGAWSFIPKQFSDERGLFFEWFQDSTFMENSVERFDLAQANCSVSAKGVLRGIHFALYPPGQRKYVTCLSGSAMDVIVDLRIGSPTFGKWKSLLLDTVERRVVSIPSGIGHGFMALEDNTSIVYLCDRRYDPSSEREINPMDSDLAIEWSKSISPIMSEKDLKAPSFKESLPWLPKLSDFNQH